MGGSQVGEQSCNLESSGEFGRVAAGRDCTADTPVTGGGLVEGREDLAALIAGEALGD